MANIQHSKIDNLCYNGKKGSISIEQINFVGKKELEDFEKYTIRWEGNFDGDTMLSSDHRTISNLKRGDYQYNIDSLVTDKTLGPYNVTITSPPLLQIVDVTYDQYSCNNDAQIIITVSGGKPPYYATVGPYYKESPGNVITLTKVEPGNYNISISDDNYCVVGHSDITIEDSTISAQVIDTLPPLMRNGFGVLKIKITTGIRPFHLSFQNTELQETITLQDNELSEYIYKAEGGSYFLKINNLLRPGPYLLTIASDVSNCSCSVDFNIPNISPTTVSCDISPDIPSLSYSQHNILPILDTIIIPYQQIIDNTNLWQYIKTIELGNSISLKINDTTKNYKVMRFICGKDTNQIEVLRLGENSDEWFFYFHIAPGINTDEYSNLSSSIITIVNNNQEYPLSIGEIDPNQASLIRGSFIISGSGLDQFSASQNESTIESKNKVYISINKSSNIEDYDFVTEITSKTIQTNTYKVGSATTIAFLENSTKLNVYVNNNQTSYTIPENDIDYVENIKNLLSAINNISNLKNIYIYNKSSMRHTGKLAVFIEGNRALISENNQTIINTYNINYYTFNSTDQQVKAFYQNNNLYNNNLLTKLNSGYLIIKVQDSYQNKPDYIDIGEGAITANDHYTQAKNTLQQSSSSAIANFFELGDILVYIPLVNPQQNHNTPPGNNQSNNSIIIVQQSEDTSNTASLSVTLVKPNIKCYLTGPQNYSYTITQNTKFTNMISGVYNIKGDNADLTSNFLYQNNYSLLVNPNSVNNIDINFTSYQHELLVKDV